MVEDCKLSFMIDSGATNNFLSLSDCEKVGALYTKNGNL